MHSYRYLLTATGLALTVCLPAILKAAPPQAGDSAPDLGLEKVLPGGAADWESLRGKVVVLEFWATWCALCVAGIPFFNELQSKFDGKPVQFISITDESEAVVAPFLRNKPIRGWVGLDTDGSAFKAYGITGRPTTVVVDQQGKLVGSTKLHVLVDHPEILDDLLAGKRRTLATPSHLPRNDLAGDLGLNDGETGDARQNRPLCLIAIRPAQTTELRNSAGRETVYRAVTIRSAITQMYDITWNRIDSTVPLPEDQEYDIIFSWPNADYQRGMALLRQAFEATFGLRIRREKRVMDVYVLSVAPGKPTLEPHMMRMFHDPETGHWAPTQQLLERMNAGEMLFMAFGNTLEISKHLDYALKRPVLDETDIDPKGFYILDIPYDIEKHDRDSLIKAVDEKYGLKLVPAKREIEVVVVDAAPTDSASP